MAAGKAQRCPDKLTREFAGMTLPEWACVFAEANGFKPEIITRQRLPGTAGALDGRSGLVLFGDNYYHGVMRHPEIPTGFTFSLRRCEELAIVIPDVSDHLYDRIVEKPHGMTGTRACFTGYCFVEDSAWDRTLSMSARGEYEITDIVRGPAILLDVDWEHYSYPEDYDRVNEYVRTHRGTT